MNTNQLKKMAAEARTQLLSGIEARLHYVRSTDSAEIREQQKALQELERALAREGEAALVERVAYTWFNRLVALRFMDMNDYQPGGMRVVSPRDGFTRPQLLEAARGGTLPADLPVDQQLVNDLLDGRRPSTNAENEVYRLLLMAACNQLHQTFPFLFESLADYTELLLPEDVISPASILHLIREGMTSEDCQEVEVLGWLYQFYIAEKKDAVFAKKGKVTAAEIPAATQLFTPRWIVEYMVQNTLGRLWLQSRPQSGLRAHMPYYLENPDAIASTDVLRVDSPEAITLLDPACGSGHILVYAFDLLTRIYEEEGYAPSEIASLILEHNLYGLEIDQRAAQLATFALLMKARSYYRRALRKVAPPHIVHLQAIAGTTDHLSATLQQAGLVPGESLLHDLQLMLEADNYGSLILPASSAARRADFRQKVLTALTAQPLLGADLQHIIRALDQLDVLGQQYHCVVANPPYMGSGKMNKGLSDWVKKNYINEKSDLFSCFISRCLHFSEQYGLTGLVTMESWMFLSSFEKFRKNLLSDYKILSLSHFGWHIMRIAFGTVSFILEKNKPQSDFAGIYSYTEIENIDKKTERPKIFPVTDNGRFNTARQSDFGKIPGSPVGYWLGEKFLDMINSDVKMGDVSYCSEGIKTSNNHRFIRYIHEVNSGVIQKKWYLHYKGGAFRKWFGNLEHSVFWENSGAVLRTLKTAGVQGDKTFPKCGFTWSDVTSSGISFRFKEAGYLFDSASPAGFFSETNLSENLGFLNSKIVQQLTKLYNPTIHFKVGNFRNIPFANTPESVKFIAEECIQVSKEEWNSQETSWDFRQNELLRLRSEDIQESYNVFRIHWTNQFHQLHQNEEELNRQFIEIYGLQEELSPDVPLDEITILQQELDQKELKRISAEYRSGWQLEAGKWVLKEQNPYPDLPFDQQEIMAQFVSYAVGCMFGRYSLDKEGLILANQGEGIADFVRKVTGTWWMVDGEGQWRMDPDKDVYAHYTDLKKPEQSDPQSPTTNHHAPPITFWPDEDNIIPVLDEEWFEDDIVARFRTFLRASFGEEQFHDNLAFLEECLGTDIRSWLVKKFYPDHIKRYKKRPIYWMISSPSGAFQALIYLHRYTPDTLNILLNDYLRVYMDKLTLRLQELAQVEVDPQASAGEKSRARKQMDQYKANLDELETWEREVVYPLASERIPLDLDDGVLVNYNKFGRVVKAVPGLNDAKTKKKVRDFDWIDTALIRD